MNEELKGNVIEKAIKMMSFRKEIRAVCVKNGLEYPSDDKIAEWIEQGYLLNVDDFIKDYKECEGIFRTPLKDFIDNVKKFSWAEGNEPTIDEMKSWTEKHGYNVSIFLRERTINTFGKFYRKTIERAFELLSDKTLVELWNWFVEESGWYAEDCTIFDLSDKNVCDEISKYINDEDMLYISTLVTQKGAKYIQIFQKDGEPKDSIRAVDNVKSFITAFWTDIVDRIMSFSDYYYDFDSRALDYSQRVMVNVFQPVIREMCRVPYRENL